MMSLTTDQLVNPSEFDKKVSPLMDIAKIEPY